MRILMTAALILGAASNAAGATFTTLDGAQDGFLSSLSRNGRIAAGSFVGGGLFAGAFVWRQGADAESIPFLSALGMNSWAQPVVGDANDAQGNAVAALAYSDLDTAGPGIVGPYPGSSPVDQFYSQAYGMSDNGIVVGLAYDASPNPIAFRWTAESGMSRLAVNRPQTFSRANGISADGNTIYGWNDHEDGFRSGVIWIQGKPIEPHNPGMYGDAFGSPPGEAFAANANGSVVVGQGYFDDLMQSQAWRWTRETDAQPIGIILPAPTLASVRHVLARMHGPTGAHADVRYNPDGFFFQAASYAIAVSADGNTIVGNTGDGQTQQAFIWTAAGGMVLLSDYAAANDIPVPDGFFLYSANALSADGRTIGGIGIDPTGSFIVPWVIDMHPAPTHDTLVIAQGAVIANDLPAGPFVGYPTGAAVSMTFRIAPNGQQLIPAHESAYPVSIDSFNLELRYMDPLDFTHYVATEQLAANGSPMLHLINDRPRADALELAPTPIATAGQSLEFSWSNPDGVLFDSDAADRINRSFGPDLFDAPTWVIRDGSHSMTIALQWVTVKDDTDPIFNDGFDPMP